MRLRDVLLVVVMLGGAVVGVLLPGPSLHLTPHTGIGMIIILFFSFLGMDFSLLVRPAPGGLLSMTLFTLFKLFLLPAAFWLLARWLVPAWDVPVLMLSAISTGVVGPFFAQALNANVVRVLQLVVTTSLLVPFSLPFLLRALAGAEIRFPFMQMFELLAMVVFIPLIAAWLVRRFFPALKRGILRCSYFVSLSIFFLISVGVFAPYAGSLKTQAEDLLIGMVVGVFLAGAQLLFAWLFSLSVRHGTDFITTAVSMTYVNNILALIFASRFLGPKSALLCVAYMLPTFVAILPLRWLKNRTSA